MTIDNRPDTLSAKGHREAAKRADELAMKLLCDGVKQLLADYHQETGREVVGVNVRREGDTVQVTAVATEVGE